MNCHNRGCYYNFYGKCNACYNLDISQDGECMTKEQVTNSSSNTSRNVVLFYPNDRTKINQTKIGGSNE